MNFIHISDHSILVNGVEDFVEPINLENIAYVHEYDSGNYHRLYFRMIDGHDLTWEFKTREDLLLYHDRVVSVLESKDLSKMTKL
jgi:hypothetical protein